VENAAKPDVFIIVIIIITHYIIFILLQLTIQCFDSVRMATRMGCKDNASTILKFWQTIIAVTISYTF